MVDYNRGLRGRWGICDKSLGESYSRFQGVAISVIVLWGEDLWLVD